MTDQRSGGNLHNNPTHVAEEESRKFFDEDIVRIH